MKNTNNIQDEDSKNYLRKLGRGYIKQQKNNEDKKASKKLEENNTEKHNEIQI